MSYKHTNKYTSNHFSDWIIHCDICGKPTWYSDSTILDSDTGRGGLLVCPDDNDAIDYGLVPYEIPTESTVDTTRINNTINSNTLESIYPPFNYALYDPMSYSPDQLDLLQDNWEDLDRINWDDFNQINWEGV